MPRSIVGLPSTNDDDGRIAAAGLGLQELQRMRASSGKLQGTLYGPGPFVKLQVLDRFGWDDCAVVLNAHWFTGMLRLSQEAVYESNDEFVRWFPADHNAPGIWTGAAIGSAVS